MKRLASLLGACALISVSLSITPAAASGLSISSISPTSVTKCVTYPTTPCPFTLTIIGSGFTASTVVLIHDPTESQSPMSVQPNPGGTATTLTASAHSIPDTARTVEVSVTDGSLESNRVPFFITDTTASAGSPTLSQPYVLGGETKQVATVGGSGFETPGSVTVAGSGSGTLSLLQYSGNPTSVQPPAGVTNFLDIYSLVGSSFTQVDIMHCNLSPGNTVLYWYDGSSWAAVSGQTYETGTGCVRTTLASGSSPSVTQLVGTVFAYAAPAQAAPDLDEDGEPDAVDNCPAAANPGQEDADGDATGDACDSLTFGGFAAPVDNLPTTNTGVAGKVYPVKWTVSSNGGPETSLEAVTKVEWGRLASCSDAVGDALEVALAAGSGDTSVRLVGDQYIFNWKTPSVRGCYALVIVLQDGGEHRATFDLR